MSQAALHELAPLTPPASGADEAPLRFEEVYRDHVAFVWRSLRRLGVAEADADDAVQDVFVVVHGKLVGFEGRSRLSTWLYGICLRVAQARRRRAYVRHEVPEETAGALEEIAAPATVTEQATEERESMALLEEALDALPLEQRAVFTLFELDGMTCQAIAELVDAPLGTVYSRLRLAREAFRRAATRIQARLGRGRAS
jgi:RNA polymerase sigma-70 factor (ECF subfamily)